jgi:Brp/Blh family beta-carotene 15,15'-monooxygenase
VNFDIAELVTLAAAVFFLGMPHGALDGREARDILRPRLGSQWIAPFILSYLGLAVATLLLWLTAPLAALILFFVLSSLHFGSHDSTSKRALPLLTRGSLPMVIASAAHPQSTAAILGILAGDANGALLQGWLAGPLLWLWLVGAATTLLLEAGASRRLELAGLTLLFALAPPLVAFALYFGLVHSPRALSEGRRPGEQWSSLFRAALPWSAAAGVLAIPLWMLWAPLMGEGSALVRTVFWWLSALTVPHMLLHLMVQRSAKLRRDSAALLETSKASGSRQPMRLDGSSFTRELATRSLGN